MIPFAEWLPDQPDFNNPGATVAKNVRPHASGYEPLPSFQAFSNALDAYPRGAFYARAADNNVYSYAGDETKLYSIVASAWTDVSRVSGGAYACGNLDYWEMAKFGEKVIATNYIDDPQIITLGGTNFAALGGTPPKARHVATVRNFVVFANTNDTDGEIPNRVRWSAADDPEDYVVSAATQSDFEDLYGAGGWIQRVFGGEYGNIFQEGSVWRMTYQGSPTIFSFDEVLPGRGLLAPGGASQIGDLIFFLSQDGFEVLTNGSSSQSIGAQKVDRFVLSDIDTSNLHRVSSAIDVKKKQFYFAYPGSSNTGGLPNKLVIYDWSIDKWSYAEIELPLIATVATPGVTLEGLDSISTNLDALLVTLDSPAWKGGSPEFGAFDSSNQLGFFTGDNMDAMIETAEVQLTKGRRTLVNAVRPIIDGGTTSIQVGKRQRQADAFSYMTASSVNNNGRANMRSNGRYHRFRANISGDWTHAQGVEPEGSAAGWR